ncbi:MAG: ATP-binding protein [Nocardioidaceae bacterium]
MAARTWPSAALIALGAVGAAAYGVAVVALEPPRPQNYAWGLLFLGPLYAVGVLAYVRRPDLPIARLLLLGGSSWIALSGFSHLTFAVVGRAPASAVWAGAAVSTVLGVVAGATAVMFFALYPDGRPRRRFERWFLAVLWLAASVSVGTRLLSAEVLTLDVEYDSARVANVAQVAALHPLAGVADAIDSVFGAVFPAVFVLLAVRYRWAGSQARRQIRWLLLVPICAIALGVTGVLLDRAGVESAWFLAGTVGQYVYLALIPLVLLVSILRLRLLDVDLVIKKSLVYAALWIVVTAVYAMTAAAVGIAGTRRLPVGAALLLTVAAAIAFQPARRALERLADRWVFGRRLPGYALIEHLGLQLEAAGDQGEQMSRLADGVRSGLRLQWVEVVLNLRADEGVAPDVVASSVAGAPREPNEPATLRVRLTHAGEVLGIIECGPRLDGAVTAEDEQVLATLARQAALAVHNARLSGELAARLERIQAQAADLEESRARIVQAGDVERRRIERDLHDGAQQQLIALLARLRLARNQLRREPSRLEDTLTRLEAEVAELHRDLVELARGIHPAVLSDRGLIEAIRSRAEILPLRVRVQVSGVERDARFPDEVEGAAYFVCSEALTNVMKHAAATHADVRLAVDHGWLVVEVADDGVGLNGTSRRGDGLANMSDRLAALGGRLTIETAPRRGTVVTATLPAAVQEGRDG